MSCSIHWKEKGLYRRFTGQVTGQEIFETAQRTQADPRFDKISYILNDFTKATEFIINEADIAIIAAVGRIAIANNPEMVAANIANDEKAIGLAEAYRNKMKDSFRECRTFTDLDEAWKWLSELGSMGSDLTEP